MATTNKPAATLYYLVGASGSGKDSILNCFKEEYWHQCQFPAVIAHRYITRRTDATEAAISLSKEEFDLRQQHGFFALDWHANGLNYGIGVEIEQWLAAGVSVIVNGSRAYLNTALDRFSGRFHSIHVEVSEAVLVERLINRQRETKEEIQDRIERHKRLKTTLSYDSVIMNDTTVKEAAEQLSRIIDHNSLS